MGAARVPIIIGLAGMGRWREGTEGLNRGRFFVLSTVGHEIAKGLCYDTSVLRSLAGTSRTSGEEKSRAGVRPRGCHKGYLKTERSGLVERSKEKFSHRCERF